jgi:single-stranded-DNA-specific exonuclease
MKIVILTHSDCDGICAGAIALTRFPKADVFFTKPVSLADDLKDCPHDKIIITDIAIDFKEKDRILDLIKSKKSVYFFDHHILPEGFEKKIRNAVDVFVHDLNASASELIYKYFSKHLPEERIWLAFYGAIADYVDNTKFFKEKINCWDRRTVYFEASTLVLGIKNPEFECYDAKREIVSALASGQNPSEIKGLVESAKMAVKRELELYDFIKKNVEVYDKIAYIKDIEYFGFRGPSALFAATTSGKKIGLCVYTRKNYIDITIRTPFDININVLAQKASEAVGGSGGGHPRAAGAKIPIDKLDDFLRELNKLVK